MTVDLNRLTPEAVQFIEARGWEIDHQASVVVLPTRCKNLTKDNLCAIYQDRPWLCRNDNLPSNYHPRGCPRRSHIMIKAGM